MPKTSSPKSPGKTKSGTAMLYRYGWLALILLGGGACAYAMWPANTVPNIPAKQYSYEVVKEYPHDTGAFTQGLVYHDGMLLEGTGKYQQSTLRKVDLETGKVVKSIDLPPKIFGEGITLWGDKVVQLSWKNRLIFIWDVNSFELVGRHRFPGEAWGLTHNGEDLIVSNGSEFLLFMDPQTMRIKRRVKVRDEGRPVEKLNELEFINGEVWANIWYDERIARIDPATGRVVAWVNLKGLLPIEQRKNRQESVLNGIAYDADKNRLFVTGKEWPKLFEIRLVEQEE